MKLLRKHVPSCYPPTRSCCHQGQPGAIPRHSLRKGLTPHTMHHTIQMNLLFFLTRIFLSENDIAPEDLAKNVYGYQTLVRSLGSLQGMRKSVFDWRVITLFLPQLPRPRHQQYPILLR